MQIEAVPKFDRNYMTYNCKDAYVTLVCAKRLKKELEESNLAGFYSTIVQPLVHVVHDINMKGIGINEIMREEASKTILEEQIPPLQASLDKLVGKHLPVSGDILPITLEELGVKFKKRTKRVSKVTGTTLGRIDKDFLKNLINGSEGVGVSNIAEIATLIGAIRKKKKVVSTFLEGLQLGIDNRVHPNYKIGPVTGRLACGRPNFQNLPAGIARRVFHAIPGYVFVYADYSALELRILAVLAQDQPFLRVFESGQDIHDFNARDLFSVCKEATVTDRQRFFAKAFQYGLNYGGSIEGIKERGAEMLADISITRMKELEKKYFDAHPAIVRYRQKIKTQIYRKGTLINAFGRPRIFFTPPREALRAGYNYPMQSAAAEIMNRSLIEINKRFPKRLLLQVHDSLMLEVPAKEAEETKKGIIEIMETPVPELNNYSFPVKAKVGESWGDFDD